MKKLLFCVLLALIFIPSCKINDEADIIEIYKKISGELPTYTHKTIDMVGISADGGTMTGYFKGKSLKMASLEYFFDTGRDFTRFYFDDDELAFVLIEKYHYNRPSYYDSTRARANNDTEYYDDRKTVLKTSRYYFKDDAMIKWVDENKMSRSDDSKDFEKMQKDMYADAKRIQLMLKEAQ